MSRSHFQRGSGVYVCGDCGKRTRETGDGESGSDLCAACFDAAGIANEHADGHHDAEPEGDGPRSDCPRCGP